MNQVPYPFKRVGNRYTFFSLGRSKIQKAVAFVSEYDDDVFNLLFGDLRNDGTIDDTAVSNNGDVIRVLVTVISILVNFLEGNKRAGVFFTGSTPGRTALYARIIKMYYESFSVRFNITSISVVNNELILSEFNPRDCNNYQAFFVKRRL